jgi:nucleotide-binding universal stress UspA family protein
MYKHLLIATDGSELAGKAVAQGLGLAQSLGARATIVMVSEPWTAVVSGEAAIAFPIQDYERAVTANANEVLAAAASAAKAKGVSCGTVHAKDQFPAEGIIDTATKQGCDLIVMASHGRRGLKRLFLGSQTNSVVTQSTIPVLVCR